MLLVCEIFAVSALALAAIGVYGVIASSVVQRSREIGIRSALGAKRSEILVMVLRNGFSLLALGLASWGVFRGKSFD